MPIKLNRAVDEQPLVLATDNNNIFISRSRENYSWLYLHFYNIYISQTYWDAKPAYTSFTLQVVVASLLIGHLENIYNFYNIYL